MKAGKFYQILGLSICKMILTINNFNTFFVFIPYQAVRIVSLRKLKQIALINPAN